MTTIAPKSHPLELVIRPSGEVELLNSAKETVWTSDGDNDFWEFIDADFCEESDIDEILGYLEDAGIIDHAELEEFENGGFDTFVEEGDTEPEDESDIIEGTAEEIADETEEV
jgi:hypothetical protein